jgi:hypothetical protein
VYSFALINFKKMKEYLITLVIVVVGVILAGYVSEMLKSKTA